MATVKSNTITHKAGKPYQLTENQKVETMNSSEAIANEQVIVSNDDKPEADLVYVIPGEFSGSGTYHAPSGKAYDPVTVTGGGGGSQTAAPTFAPAAGNIEKGSSVTLTCEDAGAQIHYTTDGSEPTLSSPTYSSPITVNADTTIKAVAVILGKATSSVASASYTVVTPKVATPVFSPAAGAVAPGTEVTITCATAGATIYYTDDGSTPTSASTEYTGAITLNAAKTLKAIAIKDDYTDSSVATANYTLAYPSYFGYINGETWGTDASRIDEIKALESAVQTSVEFTHDYLSGPEQEDGCFFVYAHPASIGTVAHVKDKVNNINYDNSFTFSTVEINGVDYQLCRLTDATAPETGTNFPLTYSANPIN